jgi:hypothetical protein
MNVSDGSLIRAVRGPISLITVGVLFALNNFTNYHFNQTWPVLLIVFGLLSLLRRGTERVPPAMAGRPGFPPPTFNFPPPETSSYRQSSYTGSASNSYAGSASTVAPPMQPRTDPPETRGETK